jgi:hypothetical protein
MCKAELNRNKKTLLTVFVGITISMVFIIGSSNSLLNIALSKSSHHSKSSTITINSVNSSGSGNSGSILKGANSNPSISAEQSSSVTSNSVVSSNAKNNNNKVVVLSFDDNRIGDFTYAKPILDKYGFKATFFIICGKTTDSGAMNWQDIAAMQKDGMDIESHSMTHAHLNTLNQSQLNFEIGGSKQCPC